MSTADTVQELARLMNKRDASDGHDVKHTGGIIGEGGGGRLGSLYGIPRYHSGGLIGAREQLAILQHGEGVFTPGQMQNADHLIATLTGSLRRIEQELIQNLGSNPRDGFSLDLLSNAITEGLIRGLANGFLPGFLGQQAVASTNPQSPTQTHSNAEPGQQILQFGNEAQDMLQQVEGYTEDALLGMENALIQFVQTGKFEFKDLTNSILNDLLQISTREAITKSLSNALGNVFSGLFGGGNGGGDPRSEHLFSSLAPTPIYHTGGIAGESTVFRRKTFEDILNHYHSGGVIGGNEEVAVLQKGEGVFTPEQMSNADHLLAKTMKAQKQPAPINVTVLIKTGNGPAKEHRGNFSADGRGGGVVTVDIAEQIEAYIAQRLARGYGPLSMVMRRRR
ncbi:MAG: phage tail tape measure C-terminal domain-containing protein [Pseudomonadota bacterium]